MRPAITCSSQVPARVMPEMRYTLNLTGAIYGVIASGLQAEQIVAGYEALPE